MTEPVRRTGAETKAEAQRVALDLFSSQGYAETSLRQIAEELGINKASLYYHFANKEQIVTSVMGERASEADELLAWAESQPASADRLERTVLRWVDSHSVDKLRGIRFITANPLLARGLGRESGIRDSLRRLVTLLAGDGADDRRVLLIRMALLSINGAVSASAGGGLSDAAIVAVAREHAIAVLRMLRDDD